MSKIDENKGHDAPSNNSRLMATIHYNDTNLGIAPGLSAWVDAILEYGPPE